MKNNPRLINLVKDHYQELLNSGDFYARTLDGYVSGAVKPRPVTVKSICTVLNLDYHSYL